MAWAGAFLAAVASVPSSHAESPAFRRASWLGVELGPPRAERAGVRVEHAVRGSPAFNAGVRDGDVIVRIAEISPTRPEDVIREVAARAPGSVVEIAVLRGGAEHALSATLAVMPDSDEMLRLDRVGSPAPTWRGLEAVAGSVPGGIGELKGRVVVIDFWAAWCTACRMAAPKLTSWQSKFGAQGLSVIGITDDSVAEAAEGARSFGMRYAAVATDRSSSTHRAFGVRALPTVFVVDRRGVIRDVSVGFDPRKDAEMEGLIRRLLAEPVP